MKKAGEYGVTGPRYVLDGVCCGGGNLGDWRGTQDRITRYIDENKAYIVNAVKTDGQNSFVEFLDEYLTAYNQRPYLHLSGKTELSANEAACITFYCGGMVYMFKRWIYGADPGISAYVFVASYLRSLPRMARIQRLKSQNKSGAANKSGR